MRPCIVLVEKIDLASGRITIEPRPGYLLVTEHGWLALLLDVERYARAVEDAATRARAHRLIVDARMGATVVRSGAVDEAYWRWLGTGPFERIAIVVVDDLAAMEIDLRAAAQKIATVRGFATARAAQQWIAPARAVEPVAQPTPPAGFRGPEPGTVERVRSIPVRLPAVPVTLPSDPRPPPLRSDVQPRRRAETRREDEVDALGFSDRDLELDPSGSDE